MSFSNDHPRPMVLHRKLDIFYKTHVVCGYSKCKGMKVNPRYVTLSHYVNEKLPKFNGLIPPTMVNNLIGDIENTLRNNLYVPFLKIRKPNLLCLIQN
jgi:hypothetical protein